MTVEMMDVVVRGDAKHEVIVDSDSDSRNCLCHPERSEGLEHRALL